MKTHAYYFLLLFPILLLQNKVYAQAPDWLWAKSVGGVESDYAWSIAVDHLGSGDVYTAGDLYGTVDFDPGAGTYNLSSPNGGIYISKLDGAGNFVWAKAIDAPGGITNFSIAVDPAGTGDIYVAGAFLETVDFDPGAGTFNLTSQNGSFDVFILKLDAAGNFIWAKGMGGTGFDILYAMTFDPSGGGSIYATGRFGEIADFDPGAGTFNLVSAGGLDIFIAKLSTTGDFIWAKAMGGTGTDLGRSIAIDPSGGGVYTTGIFKETVDFDPGAGTFNLTSAGPQDVFVSKLDAAGNFLWAKALGGASAANSYSIAIDPAGSGSVYTTGNFKGTVDFDPGTGNFDLTAIDSNDVFISKLDAAGNFVWAKAIGGAGFDGAYSIAVDPAGSGAIYTSGVISSTVDFDLSAGTFNLTSVGGRDMFITKMDASGDFVWAKAMGGTGDDIGYSIVDALGHVYMTGAFRGTSIAFDATSLTNADPAGASSDIFIAKLDKMLSGTAHQADDLSITAFPNPTTGSVQFDFGDKLLEPLYVTLTDAAGRVVISKKAIEKELDVSHLPPGLYFMKLQNGERTGVVKLLKQSISE